MQTSETVLHIHAFTEQERAQIRAVKKAEGKTLPKFYHDAIVDYSKRHAVPAKVISPDQMTFNFSGRKREVANG